MKLLRKQSLKESEIRDDYSHIYRKKTTLELVRLSCAEMGIEFTNVALCAFVSPVLLELGISYKVMSMTWAISPVIAFFMSPTVGSISDRCRLRYGRRRPFILAFAVLSVIGLLLISNGEAVGTVIGKIVAQSSSNSTNSTNSTNLISPVSITTLSNVRITVVICLTILGVVLADFASDALHNPTRAYLFDVCQTDDRERGLIIFTVVTGCGGTIGYLLGTINWTKLTNMFNYFFNHNVFEGNMQMFFTMIAILSMICFIITITTFKEMSLDLVEYRELCPSPISTNTHFKNQETLLFEPQQTYGSIDDPHTSNDIRSSLEHYIKSMTNMPYSLKVLCFTDLVSWMAHSSYALYFTDYVGETIFGGDPQAPVGSPEKVLYEEGVRFACYGLAIYSLTCMLYSFKIEFFIQKYGMFNVYVLGMLIDGVSLLLMALFKSKMAVIVLSVSCGILYATLLTVPYILVSHYHTTYAFQTDSVGNSKKYVRDLGTDMWLIGSCSSIAEFILAVCMGEIVAFAGTSSAVIVTGSILALIASVCASKVIYMDL